MKRLFLLLCVSVAAYGAQNEKPGAKYFVRVEQYGSAQVFIPHNAKPEALAIARLLAQAQGFSRAEAAPQKQQEHKAATKPNGQADAASDTVDYDDLGGVVLPLCTLL